MISCIARNAISGKCKIENIYVLYFKEAREGLDSGLGRLDRASANSSKCTSHNVPAKRQSCSKVRVRAL